MQRRDFLHHSTLSIAGLLASQSVLAHTTGHSISENTPGIALFCPLKYADDPALSGAVAMLRESDRSFDLLNKSVDFTNYKVLVLPDVVRLTTTEVALIETYLDRGGAVLASFHSGLTPDGSAFACRRFGLQLVGEAPYCPDFVSTSDSAVAGNLPETDLLMYLRGMEVQTSGASVLAWTQSPYAFTGKSLSHAGYPGITYYQRVAYFMHPVFTQYADTAPNWCKQLVLNTLDYLFADLNQREA